MSETFKIFTLKRKLRGNKAVRNSAGIGSLNAYLMPSTDVVKLGYRTAVQVVVPDHAWIAVESRQLTRKPAQPMTTIRPAETNPDLDKFKAAFGTLKGLKVFGDNSVQFEGEIRDEWQ